MSRPLKIYFAPYEVLHQNSKELTVFDDTLKSFLSDMCETVSRFNGVGLAANQVGMPIRAFVVCSDDCLKEGQPKQHDGVPLKIVNPVITNRSEEKYEPEEACMSLPSIYANVVRHKWIDIEYFDESGNKCKIEKAEGLLGQCIQHENDHINGVLITDYSSPLKRDFFIRKVQRYVKFQTPYKADDMVDARVAYSSLL